MIELLEHLKEMDIKDVTEYLFILIGFFNKNEKLPEKSITTINNYIIGDVNIIIDKKNTHPVMPNQEH